MVIVFFIILFRANDDPHGIFSVYPDNQLIVVTSQMARLLRVNVTREKGSFDSVAVEFLVDFDEVSYCSGLLNGERR